MMFYSPPRYDSRKNTEDKSRTINPATVAIGDSLDGERDYSPPLPQFQPKLASMKAKDLFKKNRTTDNLHSTTPANFQSRNQIVYIKSFNDIRSEMALRQRYNLTPQSQPYFASRAYSHTTKSKPNKRVKSIDHKLDSTLSFFKTNLAKYNPLLASKSSENLYGDNSNIEDMAFLTGVNIQDKTKSKNVSRLDLSIPNKSIDESITNRAIPELIHSQSVKSARHDQNTRSNLFQITRSLNESKSTYLKDYKPKNPLPSISEEKHLRAVKEKPKIYISARSNAVMPFGRPRNQVEHLVRVFNKETTPVAPSGLEGTFRPKKDRMKLLIDTYLGDYNLGSLKRDSYGMFKHLQEKDENNQAENHRRNEGRNASLNNPNPGFMQ
jgi:hypothetical protein